MNAYNENLQSIALQLLQEQALALKQAKAKHNASQFTLHYAQGASITAGDQLARSLEKLEGKTNIKNETILSGSIVNDLLESAMQFDEDVKQSVTHAAICAANVQVAANAIVKLSADLVSIFSIVSATDKESDIYKEVKHARDLINQTAYHAEEASQKAMELSMHTSEISSPLIRNEAQNTNNLLNKMHESALNDVVVASQQADTDKAALAAALSAEKSAEGSFENNTVALRAVQQAYDETCCGLNLSLKIKNITPGSFAVEFRRIVSAFEQEPGNYPIRSYYLFLVKESKQSLFTIANAQNILSKGVDADSKPKTVQYIPVRLSNTTTNEYITQEVVLNSVTLPEQKDAHMVYDSDNEPVDHKTSYVVFLFAEFTDEYKKMLNNFSDHMSAPSMAFTFAIPLKAIEPKNIMFETAAKNRISFVSEELQELVSEIEYRCIFLSVYGNYAGNLLTNEFLTDLETQLEKLEKLAEQFDPKIEQIQGEIISLESSMLSLSSQKKTKPVVAELSKSKKRFEKLQAELKEVLNQRATRANSIQSVSQSPISFLFNIDIAQQVSPGNYTIAKKQSNSKKTLVKTSGQKFSVPVTDATTDNFGNLLVRGCQYIPVILSVPVENEKNAGAYAIAWSGYQGFSNYFTF